MTFSLFVRAEAEEDLLRARDWYDSRQDRLGDRLLDAADLLIQAILRNPQQWAAGYRDVRRARIPRFPYVVHFIVAEDVVEIIAVMHGSQHPRTWQARL